MKRIFRMILAAAIVFSLVASSVFLIMYSDHDCDGETCAICLHMAAAFRILKGSCMAALLLLSFAKRGSSEDKKPVFSCAVLSASMTPVFLKVKLNN